MLKRLGIYLINACLIIAMFCSIARAELKLYIHAGTGVSPDFLSEVRPPGGFTVNEFVLPGNPAEWEGQLTGDISDGQKYTIGVFLASLGTTVFRSDVFLEKAGISKLIASTTFTAKSDKFIWFERALEGKELNSRAGDRLILRISHNDGAVGAVAYGSAFEPAYVEIPTPIPEKQVVPRPGYWSGKTASTGDTIRFIVAGDSQSINYVQIAGTISCSREGSVDIANEFKETIPIEGNTFRIQRGNTLVVGTFTGKTSLVGYIINSVYRGLEAEGLCSGSIVWNAGFEAMAISPKEKLPSIWGQLKRLPGAR